MSDEELKSCHNYYMNSLVWMNEENSYGRRKQQLPPGAYLASYH